MSLIDWAPQFTAANIIFKYFAASPLIKKYRLYVTVIYVCCHLEGG